MTPEIVNGCELYLGDCLDILPTLGRVDAVVTDPPYGLDFDGQKWDSEIPPWFCVAREMSNTVAFTTAPTTQWDYPRPDWASCWHRTAAQSRNAQGGFNHWSPVLVYGRSHFVVDVYYTNGMITAIENKGVDHPTPKDKGLFRWIVQSCSNPGDLVVDCFMGSGTTAIAAYELGRRFIGIEKDPDYFSLACRRLSQAKPPLFVETPAQPLAVQAELV